MSVASDATTADLTRNNLLRHDGEDIVRFLQKKIPREAAAKILNALESDPKGCDLALYEDDQLESLLKDLFTGSRDVRLRNTAFHGLCNLKDGKTVWSSTASSHASSLPGDRATEASIAAQPPVLEPVVEDHEPRQNLQQSTAEADVEDASVDPVDVQHLKLIMVGESNVGKTTLLRRLERDEFLMQVPPTLNCDLITLRLRHNGKLFVISAWDTAGQERYQSLTSSYYRGVDGVVFVYDITSSDSFSRMKDIWFPQADQHLDLDVPRMLLGNKSDLARDRAVPVEDGEHFARSKAMQFFEVSAVESSEAQRAFKLLASEMGRYAERRQPRPQGRRVDDQERAVPKAILAIMIFFGCIRPEPAPPNRRLFGPEAET